MNVGYIILVFGILFALSLLIIFKNSMALNNSKREHLDEYTNDFYLSVLDKIIEITAIYDIDVRIGELFGSKQGVTTDISNDDILDLQNTIVSHVHSYVSPSMKDYLVSVLGKNWYDMYIRTTTMSLVLNYSKLSIEKITAEKFNNK